MPAVTIEEIVNSFNVQIDQNTQDYLVLIIEGITSGGGGTNEFEVLDGKADLTLGFEAGQTDFDIPSGKVVQYVSLNLNNSYVRSSPNNAGFAGTWMQTGTVLSIAPALETEDYLYIEYK